MGFWTGTTAVPTISEAAQRQVLGQAMDPNCLTWIIGLCVAKQRRLQTCVPHTDTSIREHIGSQDGYSNVWGRANK